MQTDCTKCGLCMRVCNMEVLEMGQDGPVMVKTERCSSCGHCVAACPFGVLPRPTAPKCEDVRPAPDYDDLRAYLRSVRSMRHFKPEPVSHEALVRLIDIGRYPQTGGNSQGVSYVVVSDSAKRSEVLEAFCDTVETLSPQYPELLWIMEPISIYRKRGIDVITRSCPALILATTAKDNPRRSANCQFSLTFISLLAPTLGLGTCWAGILEAAACDERFSKAIRSAIGLPEEKRIGGVMMAGYPDETYYRLVERNPLEARFI